MVYGYYLCRWLLLLYVIIAVIISNIIIMAIIVIVIVTVVMMPIIWATLFLFHQWQSIKHLRVHALHKITPICTNILHLKNHHSFYNFATEP